MRVKAQGSARVRVVCAAALAMGMFASGPALSASGQAQTVPPAPQPARPLNASAAPTVLKVTPDEAVRMALENNLGVKADRLGPQIQTYAVAEARAAYALNLTSQTFTQERDGASHGLPHHGRGQQHPVERQLQHRRRHSAVRALGWRPLYARHRRIPAEDEQPHESVQSASRFEPDRVLYAAAVEELLHRQLTAEPAAEPEGSGDRRRAAAADTDADLASRSQRLLQPGECDRPAAGCAEVARTGADLSEEQREEGGTRDHCADRHRPGTGRGRAHRGAGDRGRRPDRVGGGRPPGAHHEPVAARLLDDQAGTCRTADAGAAADQRRGRHRQCAGQPHRSHPVAEAAGADRYQHEVPAQPAAPVDRRHGQLQRARAWPARSSSSIAIRRRSLHRFSVSRSAASGTRCTTCSPTISRRGA